MTPKTRTATLLLAALLALGGCTWVELSPQGEKVVVLTAEEVAHCKRVGDTTVSLLDRVAGIPRDREKVQTELATLARNSAAKIGGDAVVPITEPEGGEQRFAVYRCRP